MKLCNSVIRKKAFFTVLVSLLCLGLGSGEGDSEGADYFVDDNHCSCISCHRMPRSKISRDLVFPEGIDPSTVCLDCHHYSDNHHPVNFIPKMKVYHSDTEVFPLFEGEMRCLTCHRVHAADGRAPGFMLLRGGPYKSRTQVCFFCHDKDLNTKVDPHRMLDSQGMIRKVDGEPVCLICHAVLPDQTANPLQVTFRADVAFLCWRCHPPMSDDAFFRGHFLVKPKKNTRDYMVRVQAEKGVVFPLLNRERITCSTCHNPHQEGVIVYGPAAAGADAPARLRIPQGAVCSACHNI